MLFTLGAATFVELGKYPSSPTVLSDVELFIYREYVSRLVGATHRCIIQVDSYAHPESPYLSVYAALTTGMYVELREGILFN